MTSARGAAAPVLAAAAVSGGHALLAQTLLLREDLVLHGGNEVALGLFFAAWLGAVAVGAWGGCALHKMLGERHALAAPMLLGMQALLPIVALGLARVARQLSGVPAWEAFPLGALALWTLPVAVPVSLATGALVPVLSARAREAGRGVAGIWAAEASGALGFGLALTGALHAGVAPVVCVLLSAALAMTCAAWLGAGRPRLGAAGIGALLLGAALFGGEHIERALVARRVAAVLPGAALVRTIESAGATLQLVRLGDERVVLQDGLPIAALGDPARAERDAALLTALSGGPRRLLVVGSEGVDVLPGLRHLRNVERAAWVVADDGLPRLLREAGEDALADPRIAVQVGDIVRDHAALHDAGPFDAIWLMVATPARLSDDRLLTAATFHALADLVAPGGRIVVPVRSGDNHVDVRLRMALGAPVAGLRAAGLGVTLVPGQEGLLLGHAPGAAPQLEPEALLGAYLSLGPSPIRLGVDALASRFDPVRVRAAATLVAGLIADPRVEPTTADRPVAVFSNLVVRAAEEDPELARLLEVLRRAGGWLAVPLGMLGLLTLWGPLRARKAGDALRSGAALGLVASGACGMGASLVLLHAWSSRFGSLYGDLALLAALYMAGLALGSGAGGRILSRCSTARGPVMLGMLALSGLALCSAAFAWAGVDALGSRALGLAAMALSGALSGLVVPAAVGLLARSGRVGLDAGGVVEGADHAGACGAAICLGVVGLPILGVRGAAWAVTGAAIFGTAAFGIGGLRASGWLARLGRSSAGERFAWPALGRALLAIGLAVVAGRLALDAFVLAPATQLDDAAIAASGIGAPHLRADSPVPHVRGPDGALALASRAAAPRVQGYGGPLNLLVTTDGACRLRRVALLDHRETPSYVERADLFFRALEGLDLCAPIALRGTGLDLAGDPVAGAQTVDVITGASVTSRAVVEALSETGRALAGPAFSRPFGSGTDGAGRPAIDLRLVYVIAALCLALPLLRMRAPRLRQLWYALSAGVGGVCLGVQLSTVQVFALLRLEIGLDPGAFGTSLALGAGALAILFGPVYCGQICPAGAVQELLAACGIARALPARIDARVRAVKYVLLCAIVVFGVGMGLDGAGRADLLRVVWAPERNGAAWLLLATVFVAALAVPRAFCRYLCPTGAFVSLGNAWAPLRRLLAPKRYPACDLGVRGPRDMDCIHCNRCLAGAAVPAGDATRTRLALVLVGLALLCTAHIARGGSHAAQARGDGIRGQVRPVDVHRLRLETQAGRLSETPARWWRWIE